MTDADESIYDQKRTSDEPGSFSRDVDRALVYLVQLAENGIEISVTLFIGGGQVSGNVIGGKKHFEALASRIREAHFPTENTDVPEVIADAFLQFKTLYEEVPDFDTFDPTYIHLTNTRWSNGGKLAGSDGLVWRGKLASVDGFILGQLIES